MQSPPVNPNDPELQLYLEYQRRQKKQKILLALAVGIPLLLSASILIPGYIKKSRKHEQPQAKAKTTTSTVASAKGHAGVVKEGATPTSAPGNEIVNRVIEEVDLGELEVTDDAAKRAAAAEKAAAEAAAREQEKPVDPLLVTPEPAPEPDSQAPPLTPIVFPSDQATERARQLNELLELYSKAETPEEKAAFVLEPERVLPAMIRYYQRSSSVDETIGPLVDRKFYLIGGRNEYAIQTHQSTSLRGRPFDYVGLRRTAAGYRIDWESLVGYSELSWAEIEEQRPSEPVLIRCFMAGDTYYNYEFHDRAKWDCYRLEDAHLEEHLYGYAAKGSPVAERLEKAEKIRLGSSAQTAPSHPVVLRVRSLPLPEGAKSGRRGVEIVDLVQETWLVVGDPK